ncbi:hypothetical protein COY27_02430 [Candidatus Woesearchaeota archaeon CG_4_10_14_0_2_um_filter_33_13]|nr:MAG: hypothetical protein COY27_02430 [Candidatus Woesearchaeota archaeon CG_4_10_14_0_2_um_filter_33_13]
MAELHKLIGEFFYNRHWDFNEQLNEELITPEGKQIQIVYAPWKNAGNYYKIKAKVKLIAANVKDVEVEHDNQVLRLNQGLIRMTFDGYVFFDRKGLFITSPFYWFIAVLFNKYFFKKHYEKFERWIEHDMDELIYKIKNFLNTYKYYYQT